MGALTRFVRRARTLFVRDRIERELDAEIAFHIDQDTRKRIAEGMAPADAQRAARLAFGSVDAAKEAHRDGRGTRWVDECVGDVRYALRTLRRTPSLAAAAIITLALGIGANTAIFSAVSAVLLSPLPYANPGRLVQLWESNPEFGWVHETAAPANMLDWRERVGAFDGVAGYSKFGAMVTLTGRGEPKLFTTESATGDLFRVLGVGAYLGTTFRDDETWATGESNAVISYRMWRTEFGGDRSVVGSTVKLNDRDVRIVGVLPERFSIPGMNVDVWRPTAWEPGQRVLTSFRRAHWLQVVARLAPGVKHEAANAELQGVIARLQREYPETNRVMGGGMTPLHEFLVGDAKRPLLVLLTAVALLLVIACANVGNLLLVRATGRAREFAVRLALGARRARLARQAITESLVLSCMGGAAGLLLGWWGTRALAALRPEGLLPANDIGMNWQVLGFVVAITTVSGLLFGMAPALASGRHAPVEAMRDGGRTASGSRGTRRWGDALVVAEVGLALVLTLGAGLLLKSVWNLERVPTGLDANGVFTASITLPATRYDSARKVATFWSELETRVAALASVRGASTVARLPLSGQGWSSDFTADGWPLDRFGVNVVHREAGHNYFTVMRVPLIRGRTFDDTDRLGGERVAVINDALAERFFPGEDPVGRRITFSRVADSASIWRTIVGVVGSERQAGLTQPPIPEIFESSTQLLRRSSVLVVRTTGDPAGIAPAVRAVVAALDPNLPLGSVRTMRDVRDASAARHRFLAALLLALAVVGVVLALVGVYGVMAQVARGRAREMSIRLALGAPSREVRWLVVRRGLRLAVGGLVVGVAIALVATRAMRSLLYGVEPIDPLTFVVVPVLIVTAAVGACWAPARYASGRDPASALKGS